MLKHGDTWKGGAAREYWAWWQMLQRCTRKSHKSYHRYGGRGIEVCERWKSAYANFLADMGRCPDGKSLDRIDNDGDYTPENCRWATRKQQQNNQTTTMIVEYNGQRKPVAYWADELGVPKHTLYYRLHRGWSVKRAFEQPIQIRLKETA